MLGCRGTAQNRLSIVDYRAGQPEREHYEEFGEAYYRVGQDGLADIVLRKSETDAVSFETFLEDERREMNNREPHKQNLRECISMADARLTNDGTLADLHMQVDAAVALPS